MKNYRIVLFLSNQNDAKIIIQFKDLTNKDWIISLNSTIGNVKQKMNQKSNDNIRGQSKRDNNMFSQNKQ